MKITPDDPILTAYALDELPMPQRAAVEAVLRESPACRRAVEEIRQTTSLLASSLAAESCPQLEVTQQQAVLAAVPERASSSTRLGLSNWTRWLRWKPALALAVATAAFAAIAWLVWTQPREAPTVSPAPASQASNQSVAGHALSPTPAVPTFAGTPDEWRPGPVPIPTPKDRLRPAQPSPARQAAQAPAEFASPALPSTAAPASVQTPPVQPPSVLAVSPLPLKLPQPSFKGTPPDLPAGPTIEPLSDRPRPAFLAPVGVSNLALGKKVTSSDRSPITGSLEQITDGHKEALDDQVVELHKGVQWVQIDLAQPAKIYAILFWHDHRYVSCYRDVVVQVADDADFTRNVRTLFNNDYDNSAGLGLGTQKEYFETHQGRLVDAAGEIARYVRLYSRGNNDSALNCYTEVEVYALPAATELAPLPLTLPDPK